jgi:hypothetical protein
VNECKPLAGGLAAWRARHAAAAAVPASRRAAMHANRALCYLDLELHKLAVKDCDR